MRSSNLEKRRDQHGQAIVIFALSAAVLLGMLALVVDVGQGYVVRRHTQNIADQAALVGAQRLKASPGDAVADALANAAVNGVSTGVTAVVPPSLNAKPEHRTNEYIEVTVQQQVPVFFSGIIGQGPIDITARAVAKGRSTVGQGAIIALSPNSSPSALKFHGTAGIVVSGDVWSNGSLEVVGSTNVSIDGTAAAVQGVNIGNNATFTANSISQPSTTMADPLRDTEPPTAPANSTPPSLSGWTTYTPGTYTRISVSAGEKARFLPGVYIITGSQGITINGTAVGVADSTVNPDHWPAAQWNEPMDPNDPSDMWGPVHFYLTNNNGTVNMQAGSQVRFQANEAVYENIVFWVTASGNKGFDVAGGANVALIGTVYVPNGQVQLEGGANVPTVRGQVIANRVAVGGNNSLQVEYNPNAAPVWQKVVLVE